MRRCLDRGLKTTRSHMVEALRKLRYSKTDQECLSKKIKQWKFENSSDRIYFQPKLRALRVFIKAFFF